MDLGLTDKIALVSASSQGIGKAIARGLSREGCRVIICSRNKEKLSKTAREIEEETHNLVVPIAVDLAQKKSIQNLVSEIDSQFKKVDILVNNIAGSPFKIRDELTEDRWQEIFNLTVMSQINLAEAAIEKMKQNQWGRIIFVTSVAVKQPGILIANTQRASVAAYAKSLANELGKYKILVNTVCPSFVVTDQYYRVADEVAKRQGRSRERIMEEWMKNVPLQRPALPDEFANLVVFLASEKASYITGTCISVDGGFVRSLF
ncbi:MAG: SDR family oxidoreductase [Cyanobacteria bacterium SBLK]|nr:SDR family oxidoreductase [Cyanobacteria bacterium SBLK]